LEAVKLFGELRRVLFSTSGSVHTEFTTLPSTDAKSKLISRCLIQALLAKPKVDLRIF